MFVFLIIVGTLVLISASFLVWVMIHSWSRLTLLDVNNLPEVKESQKKNDILRRRAEAAQLKTGKAVKKISSRAGMFLHIFWSNFQTHFRQAVDKLEHTLLDIRRKKMTEPRSILDRNRQIRDLMTEAHAGLETQAFDAAEKAFIAVISLDPKNNSAYQGLGDVYFAEKHFSEARETYRFLLHLDKRNEHALVRLAEIAEADGALETAVEYYQQAVLINDSLSIRFYKLYELLSTLHQPETALTAIQEALALEPQNPKYIDNFIEASILVGNKTLAEDGYRRLRMVNPENQKLAIFRERIDTLA